MHLRYEIFSINVVVLQWLFCDINFRNSRTCFHYYTAAIQIIHISDRTIKKFVRLLFFHGIILLTCLLFVHGCGSSLALAIRIREHKVKICFDEIASIDANVYGCSRIVNHKLL